MAAKTPTSCAWAPISDSPWLRVTSIQSAIGGNDEMGMGNGTVYYTVEEENASRTPRSATVTVGGTKFTITQQAMSLSSRIGIFRSGVWSLNVSGTGTFGSSDKIFAWGSSVAVPVLGDWNGDGHTKVGVFQNGIWYLDKDGDGVWSSGDRTIVFGVTVPIGHPSGG